ncbi:MAG: signaling recognition particle receptor family protein, partial [Oscillospiraceae bacterium]|nr:signaling recognition particle receptor family protein [Oscillospiraceae bacterium]
MGFFDKIKAGLTKTREALSGTLGSVFSGFSEIDDDFYDELEESLILADLGVDTSVKAVGRLRKAVREQHLKTTEEAREALKEILVDMLSVGDTELNLSTHPSVILVIGVNGVGKTTTIGKIAKQLTSQGKKVMLVAGDTFRAAAADQLEIWAGRSGASIVRQLEGADPASVVFDGIQSAKARDVDVILIDTAGRLHNKTNLMNELN